MLGRFIQPDSIVPEPGNPQAFNRYSYVYNNPLRYTDPTGFLPDNVIAKHIGYEDEYDVGWNALLQELNGKEDNSLYQYIQMLREAEFGDILVARIGSSSDPRMFFMFSTENGELAMFDLEKNDFVGKATTGASSWELWTPKNKGNIDGEYMRLSGYGGALFRQPDGGYPKTIRGISVRYEYDYGKMGTDTGKVVAGGALVFIAVSAAASTGGVAAPLAASATVQVFGIAGVTYSGYYKEGWVTGKTPIVNRAAWNRYHGERTGQYVFR